VPAGKSGRTSESLSFPSLYGSTLYFFFSSLATGARRQHRGPRTGAKKSLDKRSYQRRERLFNSDVPNDDDSDTAPHALPTEASRDHRTKEQIDFVLPWVRRFQLFT
jgi:hypothetical protein